MTPEMIYKLIYSFVDIRTDLKFCNDDEIKYVKKREFMSELNNLAK